MFVPINCSTNKLHIVLWSANCFYKHFENCSRIRVYFQRPEKRHSQLFKHNWHFPIFRRNSLSVCSTSELFSNVSIQFWPLTSQLILFISSLSLTLTITPSLLRQKKFWKWQDVSLIWLRIERFTYPLDAFPFLGTFWDGSIGTGSGDAGRWDSFCSLDMNTSNYVVPIV